MSECLKAIPKKTNRVYRPFQLLKLQTLLQGLCLYFTCPYLLFYITFPEKHKLSLDLALNMCGFIAQLAKASHQ